MGPPEVPWPIVAASPPSCWRSCSPSLAEGPPPAGVRYDGKYLEIPAFDSAQVDIYEEFVVIHGLWENDPTQLMVPTHVIHHMSITP